jgi:hypothetical protein
MIINSCCSIKAVVQVWLLRQSGDYGLNSTTSSPQYKHPFSFITRRTVLLHLNRVARTSPLVSTQGLTYDTIHPLSIPELVCLYQQQLADTSSILLLTL